MGNKRTRILFFIEKGRISEREGEISVLSFLFILKSNKKQEKKRKKIIF